MARNPRLSAGSLFTPIFPILASNAHDLMPRGLTLAITIALTSTLTAQTIDQKATDAWLITRMAQRYHIAPRPLDKEMSAAIFSQLLDALDDQHLIFLADDIRQLN